MSGAGRLRPRLRRRLLRRREVWWPTWQGGLLLAAVAGILVLAFALTIDRFLAPIAPARGADGRGARTLVVEGWIDPPALHRVVAILRAGRYERVVTTGGPIEAWMDKGDFGSFAARTAAVLEADGGIGVPIVAVPAPEVEQERTYRSAVAVRDWAARTGLRLDAIDVYTADVHARRSRLVYRLAFGAATEVGVIADGAGQDRWWRGSASAKRTLGEAISWAWTECCFWPPEPGTEPAGAAP